MDTPEGPVPPESEPIFPVVAVTDRRKIITQGLVWTGMLQVFLVGANFVSMIVLVRLLRPSEYGQATAATGVLALINCFNCSYFIAQALQLHEGEEPDWRSHWSAGFYIQVALCIVCNLIAFGCWSLPAYRPMASLLHLASIGLLIDFPNQIGLTWLRRDLDYRALRLTQVVCVCVTAVSSIGLALAGAGASSLVVGSNVLHGIPFGLYLLLVRKWRPPAGWWRWPNWASYKSPLRFGAQLSASAMLTATRGILESTILPATLGYEALGLLNRAQVLFSTTAGRVAVVVVETIYPLLPRSAGNPEQFSRHATLFVQTMLLVSIPGVIFVGMDGPYMSRLLYGLRWVAADPLILPGTVFAFGVSTVLVFATVLQAQNRLRMAFLSSLFAALSCLPAMAVAALGGGTVRYAWALAAGQLGAAIAAMALTHRLLKSDWIREALLPPIFAGGAGICLLLALRPLMFQRHPSATLGLDAVAFGLSFIAIFRCFFPDSLREVLQRLPAGPKFLKALAL